MEGIGQILDYYFCRKVLGRNGKKKGIFFFGGESNQNGVLMILSFWGSQNGETRRAKKAAESPDPLLSRRVGFVLKTRFLPLFSPVCSRVPEAATLPKDSPALFQAVILSTPDSASYSPAPGFSLMETGWEHQMHPSGRSEVWAPPRPGPLPHLKGEERLTRESWETRAGIRARERSPCARYPGGYYNHLIRQGFQPTVFQSTEKWVRAYIKISFWILLNGKYILRRETFF